MNIYQGIENFLAINFAIVTSGTFDGVHKGHQKILSGLKESCLKHNGESVLITFHPHPRQILKKDDDLKLLSTLDEKIKLLTQFEVDHLLIIPFTNAFSELSSEEFIEEILIKTINTKKLVIGYDHRFGKNREGSFEYLKDHSHNYGFEIEEIPAQEIDDIAVSSTKIRNALLEGDIELANDYLGHQYSLEGTVVKGKQIGRTIGYPTANIEIKEKYKLIPADGVYIVEVEYKNETYGGMLSIGNNPTLNGTQTTIEVNIFNFNKEIYNEGLTVRFVKYMRGQIKYSNLEGLIAQLKNDEIEAKAFYFR